ncbi:MAG: ATP-dependent metallopeptidase FtsH/Yme1/Tma family protein [Myxococcales bacterium]|nr:MAG: ATP-dependent metallopeptidase FtsH/Yme1/Tma family protein [Myxococcales bacterium]
MKQSQKTLVLWVLLILMFLSITYMINDPRTDLKKIAYNELANMITKDEGANSPSIKSLTVKGTQIEGELRDGTKFQTEGPLSEKYLDQLVQAGTTVSFEKEEETAFWQQFIISWLPMIFLFAIFFFFMRQLQAGGGKAMSFGKSKAKLLSSPEKKITFKDVAGIEEAKEEVQEIIEFLKEPKKFTSLGGRIPKGVLLMGSPGTGKTLLARAIAGEADVPFFSISGSDFVEMFVGVGASRVRDLFEQGKKNAPCIIFIDEIDAVGRHRGAGLGGGHDEREQTLNQLLVEMDGFESNEGVILVAATNRPDVLDPALLRPGRFDRRVVVPPPDLAGRRGILHVHTRRVPLADEVDLDVIARGTPGFSGADLESLVNEAALQAARRDQKKVMMPDFESAKDKILLGAERRSMIISDREKGITAYHESGHALVAAMLDDYDPVQKVTIIPRGMALGLTQTLPEEDKYTHSRKYILNTIRYAMGGRAAEELVFNERTTGAGNDIQRATELARRMVCEWGMSDKLGPLAFGKREEHIFLGREISRQQDYSEEVAREIDKEIRSIVEGCYGDARRILEENRDKLNAMTEALLEYETLDAGEVEHILKGEKIDKAKPVKVLKSAEDDRLRREQPNREKEQGHGVILPPDIEKSGEPGKA